MHDLAALEQHAWVCWHYLFDGHGYHGLVEHGTVIWFTDLPSWGTYLSPHATGRLWSCSTFDWPKRCRDSGLKHCGSCVNQCWDWVLSLEGWKKTRKLWVVKSCLTLLRCGPQIWELSWYFVWHWLVVMNPHRGMSRCATPCQVATCVVSRNALGPKYEFAAKEATRNGRSERSGHPVILQNTVDRKHPAPVEFL